MGISDTLRGLGFELGRLKTGTPPRLKRSTIDWDALESQWGDEPPQPFSDLTAAEVGIDDPALAAAPSLSRFPVLDQVECRITETNQKIHDLIRANLHRAPMYSGQIESVGPRYCPSIEDKVVRFADRQSHHVFLEPESLRDDWIYCNGISTSLPADVQEQIVRAMPGCERARIYRPGYAVEYDMVRPHQIGATGMTKLVEGLFLAGQINGTSGYEEAAGQGLIAGLNAARFARSESLITLGRDQAYIGVLMDDLVTKTPVEPYRMFTSRAEHRLLLRADNAPDRLTDLAELHGLLDSNPLGLARKRRYADRKRQLAELESAIAAIRLSGGDRLADAAPPPRVHGRPSRRGRPLRDRPPLPRSRGLHRAHQPGVRGLPRPPACRGPSPGRTRAPPPPRGNRLRSAGQPPHRSPLSALPVSAPRPWVRPGASKGSPPRT